MFNYTVVYINFLKSQEIFLPWLFYFPEYTEEYHYVCSRDDRSISPLKSCSFFFIVKSVLPYFFCVMSFPFSFLQLVFIVASILFLVLAIDLRRRKKIWILTCILISLGALFVLISSFNISFLNSFSAKLGIARGAELIVYCAIIFLGLMSFHLMSWRQKDQMDLSRLISQLAINEAWWTFLSSEHSRASSEGKWRNYLVHMRVHNEAKTLRACVEEVINFGFRKFIFVNDGSSDASLEILQMLKNEHPECLFIICSHTINRWGGAANKTGFSFLQQHGDELGIQRVITFDSDGQMDINDVNFLWKAEHSDSSDVDLYVGSRFVKGGSCENIPAMRRVILIISRIVTRMMYGTKVSDPHIGFRVYKLDTLKKIHLTADGMHYANEINEQIRQLGLKFVEFPVHIRYTDYSLEKGQKNSNSIKLGVEMIWRKFF